MEFVTEYGLFFAKAITIVAAIVITVGLIFSLGQRNRAAEARGHLEVNSLNDQLRDLQRSLKLATVSAGAHKLEMKRLRKEDKAKSKAEKKSKGEPERHRVFVLKFHGNLQASAVSSFREEVSAILSEANQNDEVVVKLESTGGMVSNYGLASSQLDRIRKLGIPLTVCVDKVAASGGYMMACVADKVLAAPFAVLGSIGVVAQLPNFHRLLKKHDVDFELITAGEYKRTLTVFGENTEKGREKFIEDLEDIHKLFKEFVAQHRPQVNIDQIATGEIWLGTRALELGLVDDLQTSDEYLVERANNAEVFEVNFVIKKKLQQKLGLAAEESVDRLLLKWWDRLRERGELPF